MKEIKSLSHLHVTCFSPGHDGEQYQKCKQIVFNVNVILK